MTLLGEKSELAPAGEGTLQKVNLNGDGLRFTTEPSLCQGELLGLQFDLPQYFTESLHGFGRVVRLTPSATARQEVAISLCAFAKNTQDKLVSFCVSQPTRQIRMKSNL